MTSGLHLHRLTALLVGALLLLTACAPTYPILTGRVVDEAAVLSPATEARLSQLSEDLEARTGRQFVVVTVKSLRGRSVEAYGRGLGNQWGIGRVGQDDGVLLLVAPTERAVRIEVGKGLEPSLTDARASAILATAVLPRFKAGSLEPGVLAGAEAIVNALDPTQEVPSP